MQGLYYLPPLAADVELILVLISHASYHGSYFNGVYYQSLVQCYSRHKINTGSKNELLLWGKENAAMMKKKNRKDNLKFV